MKYLHNINHTFTKGVAADIQLLEYVIPPTPSPKKIRIMVLSHVMVLACIMVLACVMVLSRVMVLACVMVLWC